MSGTGQVNFGTFAVLGNGTFSIPLAQTETVKGGKTYWKVRVEGKEYGLELTPWPP